MALNAFKKFNRWLLPGFMFFASIILLVIGVPRFLHELTLVPGTPILERINAGEIVTEEELSTLEKSRLDALRFVELPDAYTDLGSAYLTRARTVTEREDRVKYAQMSIDASMKGLDMAPLNTFAWFRLATAHVLMGPNQYDESLDAWRKSIATAQFEPFVLMQRVHLGTILYRSMTPEDIELLKDQLGMAYRWNRKKLRQYVRQNNLAAWMALLSEQDAEMSAYLTA